MIQHKKICVWALFLLPFWVLGLSNSMCLRKWAVHSSESVVGVFERELLGGVQVKDPAGKKHLIHYKYLSPADLDYIKLHVPPELSVKTDYKTRDQYKTEWSRPDDKTILYTFSVSIEKTGRLPCEAHLTAELFVIGNENLIQDDGHLVLMSYDKKSFLMADEKSSKYEFQVFDVPFNIYKANWILEQSAVERGKTYRGVIAAVSDSNGELVASSTDLDVDWLTDDIADSIEKLRDFYRTYPGSIDGRHFNRSFENVEPPRIPWFRRNPTE